MRVVPLEDIETSRRDQSERAKRALNLLGTLTREMGIAKTGSWLWSFPLGKERGALVFGEVLSLCKASAP